MKNINFKAISARLLLDAVRYLQEWLPNGKLQGREYVLGGLGGEPGHSLSVNIDKGIWKDFSSGKGGADLISLYAAIHNIKQSEAAKQFSTGKDAAPDDTYIAGPVSPPIPAHSKYGHYTYIAEYYNAENKLVGYICRFDPPNERKQHIPRTCWRRADGSIYWRWKKWPQMSPLYRLPALIARPDAKVLIVEGEKKADRAQQLLPDWVVIAWCGGVEAVKSTDWSPLKGRTCWMWPDADQPGLKAAETLRGIIPGLRVVDIASIKPHLPEGWDLGDAPDDYDAAQYMREELVIHTQPPAVAASTLPARLDKLNSECAVIFHGSKVLIMRHWLGEDGQSKLIFMSQRDFLLWQENNVIFMEDEKVLKVGKSWLEWTERQEFEETYFEPCGKEYKRRYNLWRGFSVEPRANAGRYDLFLSHIHDNICQNNEEYYAWVIAWLADLVQRPARKLGTALVLRGAMGIGKGAFANHIGQLLGKHYMTVTQSGQLVGKFNSHMADKLLMFVDEGWWSDDRGYAEGVLRGLITEQQVTVEMKGKDAITLANYTRFIIAANADWVVPVGMGDERRFVIMDVGDAEQRNNKYFAAMADQLHNGGYEALLEYLLNYKYDEALPRTVLKTAALTENKLYSMSNELKWWHECLSREKIGDFKLSNSGNNDIECDKFYDHYQKWCEKLHLRPVTIRVLPKKLKSAVVNFNRTRQNTEMNGERSYFYLLQDIDTMKEYFEANIGTKIDWLNE